MKNINNILFDNKSCILYPSILISRIISKLSSNFCNFEINVINILFDSKGCKLYLSILISLIISKSSVIYAVLKYFIPFFPSSHIHITFLANLYYIEIKEGLSIDVQIDTLCKLSNTKITIGLCRFCNTMP